MSDQSDGSRPDSSPTDDFKDEIERTFGRAQASGVGQTSRLPSPVTSTAVNPFALPDGVVHPAPWNASPTPEPRRHVGRGAWVALLGVLVLGVGLGAYFVVGATSSSAPPAAASVAAPTSDDPSAPSTDEVVVPDETESVTTQPAEEPSSDDTTDAAMTAVGQIDTLLDRSAQARSGVQAALNDIAACRADDSDLSALHSAGDDRRSLGQELQGLDLSAVSGGSRLQVGLQDVLTASADADDAYVEWGQNQSGCTDTADADDAKISGDDYSKQATTAKRRFLALWNPIATQYGLAPRDQGEI